MPLSVGIVGLPNAGKSTLFRALTRAAVAIAPYPFTTIEPNMGSVPVPDERLAVIARLVGAQRIVPATVRVIDIAGLVRDAHKGEGLGNRFLAHIREVTAILHVVRAFHDPEITHVEGRTDPLRDIGVVETELMLADLETIERRTERVATRARIGDLVARAELQVLRAAADHLGKGEPARSLPRDVRARMRELRLLTDKPVAYVVNTAEGNSGGDIEVVAQHARLAGHAVVAASLRVEAELLDLPEEEVRTYREAARLDEDVAHRVARAAYELLDLVTFFSTESQEVRAWPVTRGTTAQRAAGEIHTDMERGFVRAEVATFDDLVRAGSLPAAREQGKMRLEGRDYLIHDGDVVTFRFSR